MVCRRGASTLRVRRLREDDSGLYECQAMNVLGQSQRRGINVVVVPGQSQITNHDILLVLHNVIVIK